MKKLVYIIDDDPVYQKFMESHFSLLDGYHVKPFSNGQAALASMHEKPFLVLLDHHLNETVNGLDYLKQIRAISPSISVLYISSDSDKTLADQSRALGAKGFILKDQAFLVRLRTFLDEHNEVKPRKNLLQRFFKNRKV